MSVKPWIKLKLTDLESRLIISPRMKMPAITSTLMTALPDCLFMLDIIIFSFSKKVFPPEYRSEMLLMSQTHMICHTRLIFCLSQTYAFIFSVHSLYNRPEEYLFSGHSFRALISVISSTKMVQMAPECKSDWWNLQMS